MEFSELVKNRYSVRAYHPRPVEEEKLHQILEAAQLAPTAANRQPFQLIVIPSTDHKEELRQIYQRDWFVQAPLIICACAIPQQAWVRRSDEKNYCDVDVAIVVDHITLAAANVGLGTCWIASFNVEVARNLLHLPDHFEPIAFTPLGYPTGQISAKERKKISTLVRYHTWPGD